jgi:CRP-like cAMP-binding protein
MCNLKLIPVNNALVDALSETAREQLQLTYLAQGAVMLEAGERPRYVYFPVGCIASLLHAMVDGSAAQVSVVGHEGMIGVELFLSGGSGVAQARAVAHCGGPAFRLRADQFRSELERNPAMQRRLLIYTQTLITQMAQTAACNRHHTVDQQLCRWLLLSLDRSASNRITITQELIANMLGVRREGITEAACKLQKRGVIAYSRGRIEILDRVRLEALSCECYGVIRNASEPVLAYLRSAVPTPVPMPQVSPSLLAAAAATPTAVALSA